MSKAAQQDSTSVGLSVQVYSHKYVRHERALAGSGRAQRREKSWRFSAQATKYSDA